MKLKLIHKLLALLLLVSVVPLTAVSLLLIGVGHHQVESTVDQIHRLQADAAAAKVAQFFQTAEDRLTADLEGSIDTMLDADIEKALVWMLGKQDNMITFRVLRVHDDKGHPIGDPVRLPEASIPVEHRPAYLVVDEDVEQFNRNVPLVQALKTGETQLSPAYVNARRGEALVAMAVPLTDRFKRVKWVITGEVSLREVQRLVSDVEVGKSGYAFLVDGEGRPVAHPRFDEVRSGAPLDSPIVTAALRSRQGGSASFQAGGVAQLGAHAPVYWGGWHLIVQQPAADAYRPVHEMELRAIFILVVALAASLACGYLYVRGLVGPLRQVMDGMRRIVDGNFDARLNVPTSDEVGELAEAFNVMGRMLKGYRTELEGWNRELQDRVAVKTKALEGAQAQLVRTSKLSALGQLGAGVAHELNNPLTGVVGQAALLKRRLAKLDLPPDEKARLEAYVQHIESESSRCREIIHGLLSFSQATSGSMDAVNVNDSIQKLLVLVQSNARAAGVTVRQDLAPDLPSIEANEPQVQQVLMHVVTNAFQAMPEGGTVGVRTRAEGTAAIAIEVSDTGRGIPPEHVDKIFDPFFTTKDVWQNTGLGLSVCFSIVESHGGQISVRSEPGKGSTFTIVLPRRPVPAARTMVETEPGGLRHERKARVTA